MLIEGVLTLPVWLAEHGGVAGYTHPSPDQVAFSGSQPGQMQGAASQEWPGPFKRAQRRR
ncbi:hypothetical protein B1C78_04525 [Thioalkalivibrio denitrificans]|uniref:Uncharacterized protein n=1 Tax=Thioalkalivibrio denitrificans TaxID=108003 RepID=A0A1V3NPU8_9GAMM|nr:hypothetical protein B1C78_04525 [Thioalkalivibrio denitrificans]